ncbi:MAG: LLM class flavin-dependent oxidoreductase [Solirubrobacterales bacterium]|nr:LLM class flavin-dependent oxidoreductase [Solirubrobacterales bacterium]
MQIGLFLAYWPWFTPEEQIEYAVLADRLGLDSVWISEAWGQDAVSVLGNLTAQTERIRLGSGLMQIPARQPTATAMAAVTLDVLSKGRFNLGLGLSGPQVSEGWYGVAFDKPVKRTREYIEIIRLALSGEKVIYDGEFWTLPLPEDEGLGLGRPLRLLARPAQENIPIFLGAIGPKAVEQVGAIADGWLPFMYSPKNPDVLRDPLLRGLEKSSRSIDDLKISAVIPTAVAATVEEARDATRPWLSFYLGAMGAKAKNLYVELADLYGYGDSARACQQAFLSGDRLGAGALLSDELVDVGTIATTPDELADRVNEYESIGVNEIIAIPCGDAEGKDNTIRALADVRS